VTRVRWAGTERFGTALKPLLLFPNNVGHCAPDVKQFDAIFWIVWRIRCGLV